MFAPGRVSQSLLAALAAGVVLKEALHRDDACQFVVVDDGVPLYRSGACPPDNTYTYIYIYTHRVHYCCMYV